MYLKTYIKELQRILVKEGNLPLYNFINTHQHGAYIQTTLEPISTSSISNNILYVNQQNNSNFSTSTEGVLNLLKVLVP